MVIKQIWRLLQSAWPLVVPLINSLFITPLNWPCTLYSVFLSTPPRSLGAVEKKAKLIEIDNINCSLLTRLDHTRPILKTYLPKFPNISPQISKFICPMYCPNLKIYLSKLPNAFVQITKWICSNLKMYSSNLINAFGLCRCVCQFMCLNCFRRLMSVPIKNPISTVKTTTGICLFQFRNKEIQKKRMVVLPLCNDKIQKKRDKIVMILTSQRGLSSLIRCDRIVGQNI